MAMHQNTTKMWHRKQCGKSYTIGWFVDLVTMALGWHLEALPFRERHSVLQGIPDLCQTVRRHDVCLLGSWISCHSSCPTSLAWLPESVSGENESGTAGRWRPSKTAADDDWFKLCDVRWLRLLSCCAHSYIFTQAQPCGWAHDSCRWHGYDAPSCCCRQVLCSSPFKFIQSVCHGVLGCIHSFKVFVLGCIHSCYTSLLQNIVSFIGLFCKRDL